MRQAGALAPRDVAPGGGPPGGAPGGAEAGDVAEAGARSQAGLPARILVVDNDAAFRRFVGDALRSSGYDVAVAAGGRDALAAVYGENRSPALLLTDIEMPGMNGVELAARVRADRPAIRVILMTGRQSSAARARERAGLVEGVLLKPFGLAELLDAVTAALGGPPGGR